MSKSESVQKIGFKKIEKKELQKRKKPIIWAGLNILELPKWARRLLGRSLRFEKADVLKGNPAKELSEKAKAKRISYWDAYYKRFA